MKSTVKGRQDNARYRLLLIIIFTRITLLSCSEKLRMQRCVDEGHYIVWVLGVSSWSAIKKKVSGYWSKISRVIDF